MYVTAAKDFLKIYWPLAVLALGGLIFTFMMMKPAPPSTIRFAAGSPGGAYYTFAERYKRILEEEGVEVELIATAGSIENLRLLNVEDVDLALVQGGLATESDAKALRSLGGMFYEPLWVFVRADGKVRAFEDLRDKRLSIGGEGSGTRMLVMQMQQEFGGVWAASARLDASGEAAASALLAGTLDAVAFSAAIDAPYVQRLLRSPDVRLVPFERAPALARRTQALADVTLLRGVVDIGRNLPVTDTPLVASVAQLGVREDLHPALHTLLVDTAFAIHSDGSLLNDPGAFPDGGATDLPISRQAARYYRDGPSALRRYFSFGFANFLDRAWILAIPLLTLLFPLVRVAPPIYRWRVRRKIYIWYEDLRDLETRGRRAISDEERERLADELRRLQAEIGELEVPLSYTDDLYRLRSHVEFVKQLVTQQTPTGALGV
jgi:TRAP transporter TAXI family solute receptor